MGKKFLKGLRLSLEWGAVLAILLALIAGRESVSKVSILWLGLIGAVSLIAAFWEHGWLRAPVPIGTPIRAMMLVIFAIGCMVLLGWFAWPTPKQAAAQPLTATPTASEIADEVAKHLPQQLPPPTAPPRSSWYNPENHAVARNDWRHLTDWQKVMLTSRLSGHQGQRLLILAANSDESLNYAGEFKKLFAGRNLGWKVEGPHLAPVDEPVADIQLSTSDENWEHPPDVLMVLKNTLTFIGVHGRDTFVYDPNVHREELVLWIGPVSPHGENNSFPPLEVRCRNPVGFEDVRVDDTHTAKYTRFITIARKTKPSSTAFRVFFSLPVLSVAKDQSVHIDSIGKVMRRNDVLEVVAPPSGSPLSFLAFSDQDTHVTCVDEWK